MTYDLIGDGAPPNSVTFENYINNMPHLAPRSKYTYVSLYKRFKKLGYQDDIHSIMRYLNRYRSRPDRNMILHYAKYTGDRNLYWQIKELPFKRQQPKPHNIPTQEEFIKVMKYLKIEERMIAKFLFYTGARIHEAFLIYREDLHDDGTVTLRTKGGKYRTVTLPYNYYGELLHYVKEVKGTLAKDKLFYNHKTGNLETKRKYFAWKLNRTARTIINKTLPTHDFRRFCATFLYSETRDIEFVRRILGHEDISSTHRYTQYVVSKHDNSIAQQIFNKLERKMNPPQNDGG